MTTQLPKAAGSPRVLSRDPGVLVLDDDGLVRRVVRAGLTRAGLRVWDAFDGAWAVERYWENAGEIDVVPLDVHMTGQERVNFLDECHLGNFITIEVTSARSPADPASRCPFAACLVSGCAG